jgi:hypothetical protein
MNPQIIKLVISLIFFVSLLSILFLIEKKKSLNNRYFFFLILFIIFLGFVIFSFNKNGQLLGDSGRTLYTPTRILMEDQLYKDINWQYAPLAPYISAFLYKIFGISYAVLQIEGIILLFFIITLFFLLMQSIFSAKVSFLLTLIMMGYYALEPQGIIIPYTFSFVYGLLFSLLSLIFFSLYLERGSRKFLVFSALVLGLTAISRQEYAFAVFFSISLFFVISKINKNNRFKGSFKDYLMYLLIALLIPLLVYSYFIEISSLDTLKYNLIPNKIMDYFKVSHYFILTEIADAFSEKNYLLAISNGLTAISFLTAFLGLLLGFYIYKREDLSMVLENRILILNLFLIFMLSRFFVQGTLTPLVLTSIGFIYFYYDIKKNKYFKALLILLIILIISAQASRGIVEFFDKNTLVTTDRIYAYTDSSGKIINEVVDYMNQDTSNYTLIAAPTDTIYYFLLKKRNVLNEDQLSYGILANTAEEQSTINRIEEYKVKYILISNIPAVGKWTLPKSKEDKIFGINYNLLLMSYINQNYEVNKTFGKKEGYFVTIYVRK